MPAQAEVAPSLPSPVPAPTVPARYSAAESDSTATDIEEDLDYSDSFESIDAAATPSAPAPGPIPPVPAAAPSIKPPQTSTALSPNEAAPKGTPPPDPSLAEPAQPTAPPLERAAPSTLSTPPPSTPAPAPDPPTKSPRDARTVTFGSPIDPTGHSNESAAAATGRLAPGASPSAKPPSPAAPSPKPPPVDAPSSPLAPATAGSAPRDALAPITSLTESAAPAAAQAPQPAPPLPERPPEATAPSTAPAPSTPSAPAAPTSASLAIVSTRVPALQLLGETIQPGDAPAPPPPSAAAPVPPSPQQPPGPSTAEVSPAPNPAVAAQPASAIAATTLTDSAAPQPAPQPPSDPPALPSPAPSQPPAAAHAQPSQPLAPSLASSDASAAKSAPEALATSAAAGAPASLERPGPGQPGQAAASAPPGKATASAAAPKTAAVAGASGVAAAPPPPSAQPVPTKAPPPPFLVKPLRGILLAQRAVESELQAMARSVAEHGLSDILALPALVPVPGGHHGLSSRFLDENLEAWLRAAHPSGLHWRDALPLLLSLSDSLVRLHRAKIHHRNIKPSNVFIAHLDASVRQRGPVFAAAAAAAASEYLPIPAAPLALSDPLLASLQDPKVLRAAPGTLFQGQEWWAPEQLTNQRGTDPPPRPGAAGGAATAGGDDEDRLVHFPTDSIDFSFQKGGASQAAPLGPLSDSAARTDSFGWGAVALFVLTGRHPMGSDKVEGIFKAHANATTWAQEAPPAPSSAPDGLPSPLRALVAACLSRDPYARPDAASIHSQLVGIWKGTYRSQTDSQAQAQTLERLKDSVSVTAPIPAPEPSKSKPESDAAPQAPPSIVGQAPPPGDRFEIARLGGGAAMGLAMGPLPWRRGAAHLVAGVNEPRKGVTVWAFGAQGKGSLVETLSEIKTYYDDDTERAVVRHVSPVTCAAFHPTRVEVLAVGDTGGMVGAWDWPEETMITMHKRHGHHCNTVSFHPTDPDLLGIGYSHGLALIWNWKEGGAPVELRGHNDWVTSLAFSPHRPHVVLTAGKMDRTARLWDFKLRRVLQVFEGYTGWVRSVCFHPSEPDIIAIGSGGFAESGGSRVRVWDTEKKECLSDMTLPGNGEGCSLSFHPARPDLLAAGGARDNTAKILNWRRRSVEFSIGHPSEVETVAFSPRSPYLLGVAGGSEEGGSIRLYMLGM